MKGKLNHVFTAGTVVVCITDFDNVRKAYPEYYYPKKGEVSVVDHFERYSEGHYRHKSSVGLIKTILPAQHRQKLGERGMFLGPLVINAPKCSYNFRKATRQETEQLISETRDGDFIRTMAELSLEKCPFPLKQGAKGINAYRLQKALWRFFGASATLDMTGFVGDGDGVYGPKTISYVTKFFGHPVELITERHIKSIERAVWHKKNIEHKKRIKEWALTTASPLCTNFATESKTQ